MAGFFDRIREGAEKAAFEADRLRRLSQAQSELRALFRRLESDTAGLGRRMLQLHDDGALTQPELLEECTAIAPVRQEIEAKEYEIQRIREEKPPEAPRAVAFGHICPKCKIELPDKALFCHVCGSKAVDIAPPTPADSFVCSHCGEGLEPAAALCPHCGTRVQTAAPVASVVCPNCGATIPAEATFCPECGQSRAPGAAPGLASEEGGVVTEAPTVVAGPREPEPRPAEIQAATRACSYCGTMIPEEAVFCPECGQLTARQPDEEELPPGAVTVLAEPPEPEPKPAEIQAATRACSYCGAMIPEEAAFCPECGHFTAPEPEPTPAEIPVVARACSYCGAMIPEESVFCPECGYFTAREPHVQEELPPEAPAVLAETPEPEPTPAEMPAVTRACSHCDAMIPEEAVFCPECGQDTAREPSEEEELPPEAATVLTDQPEPEPTPAEIPAVTRACSHCGAMIPEEAVFCPECGQFSAREPGEEEELPPEAPTVLTDQPEPEPTPAEVPAATRACSYCGAMIPEKAVFCPECGRPPEPAPAPKPTADVVPPPREKAEDESIPLPGDTLRLMRCPKCHAGIPAEALSCPECGHSLARTSGAPGHAEPYPVPEGAPILGSEHVAEPSGVPEEPLELGMATARDVPEQEKSAPTDRVPPATMSCPHCLGLIEPDMEYCPHCRQPLVDQEAESAERPSRPQDAAEATPQPEPVIKAGSRAPATCPFCLGLVRADAEVCPTCGQPLTNLLPEPLETRSSAPEVFQPENAQAPDQPILPSDDTLVMMRCPHCRASIPAMAAFCPECGARLS
jgi:RNA polymerase subunit RPABC4/transcription elongation factor Spt4